MSAQPSSKATRQHVLRWLDKHGGGEGRRSANAYRKAHGLKIPDRCTRCGTSGHYYTCPESDRVAFCCSNFTKADKERVERAALAAKRKLGYQW
jgi:hypothetical protein